MKKIAFPAFVLMALLTLVSACKKEDDDNQQQQQQQNTTNPLSTSLGGSPTIPADAAGALYAVNNYVISDDGSGPQVDELGSAYAWFDSYTTTKDAGTVSCNGTDLQNNFAGTALPWYYTIGDIINFSSTNTATWSVAGSSAVTGFTHTDNTAFPKCSFTVPSSISRSSSYTVTSTYTGANDYVFFTLYGQGKPKVTKSMPANAASATFTAAEVQSVSSPGSLVGVQVMPVKLTPVTKNGKTYYFVKQWAFAQFTEAN